MIGSVLWIAAAAWQGIHLEIYKTWWISDAVGGLILLVLLFALFPKKKSDESEPKLDELQDEE